MLSTKHIRLATEVAVLVLILTIWHSVSRARDIQAERTEEAASIRVVTRVLEDIVRAQELFRERKIVDTDGDGKGEYGFLSEILALQVDGQPLIQSEIPVDFVTKRGFGSIGDYYVTVYLPGSGGEGAILDPMILRTYDPDRPDPDLAEEHFVVYAWPKSLNWMALDPPPTFATDKKLEVFWSLPFPAYVGARRPSPLAAFPEGTGLGDPLGGKGQDQGRWISLEKAHHWF